MKSFLFAMSAAVTLAAYAGDVANTRCSWTVSGYACDDEGTVAATLPMEDRG